MLLFICSETEDEIIRHVFSTRKPLLSHNHINLYNPCFLSNGKVVMHVHYGLCFCDDKHSVQHKTKGCLFTALVMVLQIKGFGRESGHIANFQKLLLGVVHQFICKSFRYFCPIYVVVAVFVQTITTNIYGNNVERRSVIIISIFYYLDFVLSRKKIKDQKLGAYSMTNAPMSCDTILIKTERHIACPPSSG